MNLSLDDHISNRLGIENRLGPFTRSISFWATVALAAIVLIAIVQKRASWDLTTWMLFVASIVAAMAFHVVGRSRITRLSTLSALTDRPEEFRALLRSVSSAFTVLTGLVLACVLIAVTFAR